MRDAGVGLDEVADRLKSLRMRMGQIFTVDDLFCLKRGGRLSGGGGAVGHGAWHQADPVLQRAGADTLSCAKVRGRRASIQALADRYDQLVEKPEQQCIGIAHCDCYPDVQTLITLLNRNHPPARDHDRHVRARNRRARRTRRAGAVLLRKPCQPGAGKVVNLTGGRQ